MMRRRYNFFYVLEFFAEVSLRFSAKDAFDYRIIPLNEIPK